MADAAKTAARMRGTILALLRVANGANSRGSGSLRGSDKKSGIGSSGERSARSARARTKVAVGEEIETRKKRAEVGRAAAYLRSSCPGLTGHPVRRGLTI